MTSLDNVNCWIIAENSLFDEYGCVKQSVTNVKLWEWQGNKMSGTKLGGAFNHAWKYDIPSQTGDFSWSVFWHSPSINTPVEKMTLVLRTKENVSFEQQRLEDS